MAETLNINALVGDRRVVNKNNSMQEGGGGRTSDDVTGCALVSTDVGSGSEGEDCCDMQATFPRIALNDQDAADCNPSCPTLDELAHLACSSTRDIPSALFTKGLFQSVRQDHSLGLRDKAQLEFLLRLMATSWPNFGTYEPAADGSDWLFTISPRLSSADGITPTNQLHLGVQLTFGGSVDESALGANVQVSIGPAARAGAAAATDVGPFKAVFADSTEDISMTRFFSGRIMRASGKLILLFGHKLGDQEISPVTLAAFPRDEVGVIAYNVRVRGLSAGQTVSAELVDYQSTAIAELAQRQGV